jgi:hypothetical protein
MKPLQLEGLFFGQLILRPLWSAPRDFTGWFVTQHTLRYRHFT